jgi:MoxR-like ATPase
MENVRPSDINPKISALIDNIEKVIIGKRSVIELVIAAMLSGGHVLIEDVPGVGKTQLVSALANSCGGSFGRLQLTPDIMPGDITGYSMLNTATGAMEFRKGAAFCNFLLADEINRASPKSQSALLEVMEEGQISVDGNTYELPKPFMVLATQNPVETYGTYHLPEAQMDRFLMKLSIGYPGRENELAIIRRSGGISAKQLKEVLSTEDIAQLKVAAACVKCSRSIEEYIVDITEATRRADFIRLGASPRASLALYSLAKSYAFIAGRDFVIPDDVKLLAPFVLSHRIILTQKGRAALGSTEVAVAKIIETVAVPLEQGAVR